jgi:hypothetical protein
VPTEVVDVRDLASWLLTCAEKDVSGTFNAVGPMLPFGEWLAQSRAIGGHTGPVVVAESAWLKEQGVKQWMGEESLALWLDEEDWEGFGARSGEAARAAGLTHRPVADTLADTLAWEREKGLDRARKTGLSPARERELIESYRARGSRSA